MRDILLLVFLGITLLAVFRYPFAGVLLWAWFTIASPQNAAWTASTLSLQPPITAIAILSLLLHGELFRLRMSWLLSFLLLFLFWIFLSQWMSLSPAASAVAFDRFWKVMLFVVICSVAVTDRLRFTALLWVVVLIMGFYGVKGGVFTLLTAGQNLYFGLERTVLYDNNHIGIAMATFLPMLLYVANQATHRLVRMGSWAVFALTIVAIIGTYSRGAFICLVVFGALYWWQSRHKFLIGAAGVIMALGIFLSAPGDWIDRMVSISEAAEDQSFQGRIDAWVINWELATENPLTGAGLRAPYDANVAATVSDRQPRAAHSIYFEVLGGTGFAGLIIYLGIWVTGFFAAFRTSLDRKAEPWRREFSRYATMSLIIFGIGGASVSLEMWEGYLILLVLAHSVRHMTDIPPVKASPIDSIRERIQTRARQSMRKPA
ncbi:putative O-glycosylation ligase, exosortase A system-associated [Parvularcula marina]|uniref:Putative O-glycosylation ligase, exosortase A system-associated n=1 Tax=Parvularcula marina TaxID=2292771 RepID=A0A371R818_9PROT|nr:putative O-glycosylation ligase, exosortase A system-associated [Parvularcula marina]RFB01592.1 putative O-glycosylation ligase, exosortase A system-associated [Parvularcula marina]